MVQAGSNALGAKWALLCLCLLAIALKAASQLTQEGSQSGDDADQPRESGSMTTTRALDGEPSIFDFQNYIHLFKKAYKDKLEKMARFNYFSVRAVAVFISAVKYRHGEQAYYLAINKLSDATPEELDKMRNRVLEEEGDGIHQPSKAKPVGNVQSKDTDADTEASIEANLRQLARENQDEPGFKKLGEFLDTSGEMKQRKKREATNKELRHLPKEKLINTGSTFKLDPEVRAKLTRTVPSNNPYYKPVELFSQGLTEQAPVTASYRKKPLSRRIRIEGILHQLDDLFADDGTLKRDQNRAAYSAQNNDEVFLDLRKTTKCFTPPRDQLLCGSCYAFAATTIAEWLYCMQTGSLVAFSEQYLMDCGKAYVDGIRGCDGGQPLATVKFLHNFGLELGDSYPYLGRVNQCPYFKDEPLITTGAIRTNMPKMLEVSLREIPHLLKFGPLFVSIKDVPSFMQYGGGVHSLPCDDSGNHAAILVGHGRENGREYWLIRNSYGVDWGEEGYFKLDKSSDGICQRVAYAFATKHGFGGSMNAYDNPSHSVDRLHRLRPANRELVGYKSRTPVNNQYGPSFGYNMF